ncbi:MAG: cyclic nucleotide-binding domain-containing protein, partial [Chloroflexota bacterium]|nr:cyclic nucleotide-binding domain-containing protein [Chloroflexota bacterium]
MEQPPGSGPLLSRFVASMATSDLHCLYDDPTQADIEAELEPVHLSAGSILFRQGDAADTMFVLTRGRLAMRTEHGNSGESVVNELVPGATVGEMALLTGQPRAATVYAVEAAELVALSRASFDRLAEQHPQTMQELARAILPRLHLAELAGVLTDLFGPLDTAALRDLQSALTWLHLPGGTTLFRQGEPGDAMYIVVNGCLRVTVVQADSSDRVVGEARRGASVGEWALLTGEPRSATAYATRDTNVVKLPQDAFMRVLERYPRAVM